jgi:hypothetical protein
MLRPNRSRAMSAFWVFIVDPKNFLALIGLWTVIRTVIKVTKWISRPAPTPRPVNLTKD